MKDILLILLRLIIRLLALTLWAFCRFGELFFGMIAGWLQEIIKNPRKL